jgi:hypothetical protein
MDPKKLTWAGWALGGIPALMLVASGISKLTGSPELAEGFGHLGWPTSLAVPLGILEIAVTILYLIPQTAVLGAILVTGYMGGAIATHVRVGDPFVVQLLIGMAFWGGLYFRDSRIRALIPLRG